MSREKPTPDFPDRRLLLKASVPAVAYLVICSAYIVLSSRMAAALAESTQQLQTIEAVKGILFVIVTSLLFFFLCLSFLIRIERQKKLLLQSERRAVAAMCSATLAHDLNNFLLVLYGVIEKLREREEEDTFFRHLREELEQELSNLSRLARRLTQSTRQLQPEENVSVNLPEALSQIAAMVRKHPALLACSLRLGPLPETSLPLPPGLLEQAMVNLIINAAQAAGRGGEIEITGQQNKTTMTLDIHDSGPGVSADMAETIFDLGFTTKKEGTGLGLLSAQAFASSCGATLTVGRSPRLGGALFRLEIPLQEETPDGRMRSAEI